jgi:cytochrome c oxidase subunit II
VPAAIIEAIVRRAIAARAGIAARVASSPGRLEACQQEADAGPPPGVRYVLPYNGFMGRLALALLAASAVLTPAASGQEQAPNRRDFMIVARDHRFTPERLEVSQDDLVKITLRSEDRPHSFVIDAYRIVKRVGGGQTISFEFRADQAGTFEYYCSLTSDPDCKDMKGTLVVKGK